MNFEKIIKEELNTQFVNKELAGLDAVKKRIDAVMAANPLLSKELSPSIAEIDKKINGLKYAVAEYTKNKALDKKTGVGTQTPAVAAKANPIVPTTPVAPTASITGKPTA